MKEFAGRCYIKNRKTKVDDDGNEVKTDEIDTENKDRKMIQIAMFPGRSINPVTLPTRSFKTYCKDNSMTYVDKKIKYMSTINFEIDS